MTLREMTALRLYNQQISTQRFHQPCEVVHWLGAVQAQDFAGSKWAIGLRLPDTKESDIEKAIADRTIIRTWPMRGTLHFVAAEDIRWMLKLLTPRIISSSARRERQLALNEKTFTRCKKIFIHALAGGKQLARNKLYELLEQHKISPAGQRGLHILWRLSQEGLLCFATHQGKQPAFALLDEWIPQTKNLSAEEALAEITIRYFTSHGPATLQDFVWWTGLKIADARKGLEMVQQDLQKLVLKDTNYWMSAGISPLPSDKATSAYLLPAYDEYTVGYTDRSPVAASLHQQKITITSFEILAPILIINGQVSAVWKRMWKGKKLEIVLNPLVSLTGNRKSLISGVIKKYEKFLTIK